MLNFTKEQFVGKRVRMIEMNDPYPIENGTEGIIVFVDGMGHLGVKWDNGRTLSIIPEEDKYEILE